MKHIYAAECGTETERLQAAAQPLISELDGYLSFLKGKYNVTEPPRCIVWTDTETATHSLGDIPVPAYTNDYRTVMVPFVSAWREVYLRQLDGAAENDETARIRDYYSRLNERNVLQILGHEMAHHSEFFMDEAYERSVWFEEGMAEYISRRYFLTPEEFDEEAEINRLLLGIYGKKHGDILLEGFGAETYSGDFASIFASYWRSFIAVSDVIDAFGGDEAAVFGSYAEWFAEGMNVPLSRWFSEKCGN